MRRHDREEPARGIADEQWHRFSVRGLGSSAPRPPLTLPRHRGRTTMPAKRRSTTSRRRSLRSDGATRQPANFFDRLEWRCAGPYRGGRVGAVAGDPRERNTFYFGSTGGGVWKTLDGGV